MKTIASSLIDVWFPFDWGLGSCLTGRTYLYCSISLQSSGGEEKLGTIGSRNSINFLFLLMKLIGLNSGGLERRDRRICLKQLLCMNNMKWKLAGIASVSFMYHSFMLYQILINHKFKFSEKHTLPYYISNRFMN